MTDAEAKAKKVKVVKVAKTAALKPDLVDLTEAQESLDKKPVVNPLKKSTIERPATAIEKPATAKKPAEPKNTLLSIIAKEAFKGAELDKDADPATDPIAACFNERIKAGGI